MELRSRILQAAAAVYSETGFRGATTRRIAERAGVNEITLFRHFGSKTRLLHEAIACADMGSHQCELPSRPVDPRRELGEWARRMHAGLYERRSLIRTAMGEIEERPDFLPPNQSATVCAGRSLFRYVEELKAAGLIRADAPAGEATTMLMGTLFSDAMSRDILPQLYVSDADRSIEVYVELFLRAIGFGGPTP